MGIEDVDDPQIRAKKLGSWASNSFILLHFDYSDQIYFAHTELTDKNPLTGKTCNNHRNDNCHDYRHMTGNDSNDVGGYMEINDGKTAPDFGNLVCRYCRDELRV